MKDATKKDATMKDATKKDVIVIGAGSGGLTVAVGLAKFGKQVALVEAKQVGGDCTNVGCIPSKSLLHHSAHSDDRSSAEVLAKVRTRRDELRDSETEHFASLDGIELIFGSAHLDAPDRVTVTGEGGATCVLEAKHIVVATGSKARRIPIPGLADSDYLTNEELFEIPEAPGRLVIIGAGPIGIEMATAFRRLGSEVVVLDAAPRVLPLMLLAASEIIHRSLTTDGVDLRPGLVAKHFDPATRELHIGPLDGDVSGVELSDVAHSDVAHSDVAHSDVIAGVDKVLVAVGRVPNSEGLGLEPLGVELERGRIKIDDKGKTSIDGIWATGDVTTEGATTHAANIWGRRIIKHILAPVAPAGTRPVIPNVTFASPEAATIGAQPEQVRDDVRRITFDLAKADRAYTDEVTEGLIVVDVRRFRGTILGATIVGPRAGELISIFSLAMKNGLPLQKFYGTVWPYPSYADALGAVVDEYMSEALPNIHKEFFAWLKGRLKR